MRTAIITIIMFLSVGFCRVQGSSPPWGGDGHYTFGDEDPFFTHGEIYDTASVDIVGGSFADLHCWDYSTVTMTGGEATSGILVNDSSTLYLSGGTIPYLDAEQFGMIHFYVDNYNFDPDTYINFDGLLTGTWANSNGDFEILIGGGTWSPAHVNIVVVPEPATIIFFGFGCIFLKRMRR